MVWRYGLHDNIQTFRHVPRLMIPAPVSSSKINLITNVRNTWHSMNEICRGVVHASRRTGSNPCIPPPFVPLMAGHLPQIGEGSARRAGAARNLLVRRYAVQCVGSMSSWTCRTSHFKLSGPGACRPSLLGSANYFLVGLVRHNLSVFKQKVASQFFVYAAYCRLVHTPATAVLNNGFSLATQAVFEPSAYLLVPKSNKASFGRNGSWHRRWSTPELCVQRPEFAQAQRSAPVSDGVCFFLCSEKPGLNTTTQIIVDCCAVGRKQSSGREASAAFIARQIACSALTRLSSVDNKSLLIFCFDSAEHHTPMRAVCAERRYARPTAQRIARAQPQLASGALQLHDGRLYRPDEAPYSNEAVDALTIHTEVEAVYCVDGHLC